MGLKQFNNKPRRKLKKGLWSPDEDDKLRSYIHNHGVGCWNTVPISAGLLRNGKSCRLRWINYLRPGLKRETFSFEEEEKILRLHNKMGNKWSQMARCLPGRTDNEIKNHWHTNLKKGRGNNDGFISLTDADARKCISTHENSPPTSITTIPYACSNESFGKTDVSLAYIDQALSNLPKVFFAEWLTIDQTHGEVVQSNLGNPMITRDLQEEYKTNFQNSSMQSLLLSEEMLYESILNGIQNSSTYGVFYPTLGSKCT